MGSKVHRLEDAQGGRQTWKESVLEKAILIDNQVPCGLCCGLLIPQSMFCCRIQTAAWRPWTMQTGRERQWNQCLSHKRALVSSSQSSEVALLAPLFAPTSTGKNMLDSLQALQLQRVFFLLLFCTQVTISDRRRLNSLKHISILVLKNQPTDMWEVAEIPSRERYRWWEKCI